jgi:hypothetical protein
MSMGAARNTFIAASVSLCALACVGCGSNPTTNGTVSDSGADGSAEAEASESGSGNASDASYDAISLSDPPEAAVDAWRCLQANEDCTSRPADCCQSKVALACCGSVMGMGVCCQPGLQ